MTDTGNPNLHTPDDPNDPDDRNNKADERDDVDIPVGIERRAYEKTIGTLVVIIVAIVFMLIAFYYLYGYRTSTVLPTTAPAAVQTNMPMSEIAPPGANTAPTTAPATTTTTTQPQ